jgi:hypothetical protein
VRPRRESGQMLETRNRRNGQPGIAYP